MKLKLWSKICYFLSIEKRKRQIKLYIYIIYKAVCMANSNYKNWFDPLKKTFGKTCNVFLSKSILI